MKENSFLKHFSVIGAGSLIYLLLGVLTTPIITRIVDPVEYGQLSIFTMYTSIAVMVLCLGLDQALVRYYYEQEGVEYKRSLLFRCIILPVAVSVVLSVVFVALVSAEIISFEFDTLLCVLLCLNVVISLIYRFSQLLVRLAYKSSIYAGLNVLQKISYVALALSLLVLTTANDFVLLALATVASYFICMVVSIIVQREEWSFGRVKPRDCPISFKELIRYGYPYIFSMGITTLFQAIDKMSLNYYCTYTEVGIYSSTMSIIHVFAIIQTTFNALWAPMAVEHYTKDSEDRSFYQQGNRVITVIMFFIGISLILCKDVFALLLGEKYREAAYILPFLIFNPIMYTISETTVSGLVFMKKSKLQVVVAAGACVTNLIGNTILVPRLGCQGAAISTGISYIVFFALRTVLSNRYFKVDFHLGKFAVLTAVTVLYAFYNTFVKFNIFSVVGYIVCLAVLVGLYRETVIWGIKYVINLVKDWLNKRRSTS